MVMNISMGSLIHNATETTHTLNVMHLVLLTLVLHLLLIIPLNL